VALNGERYTWRHDSVLSEVQKVIHRHVEDRNANVEKDSFPHISSCFVLAGKSVVTSKKPTCSGLISGTNDWKLLVDLPGSNYVFPPEILATLERPDIVIWSAKLHKVYLIELTCPAEENIQTAQNFKTSKYLPLMNQISADTNWTPLFFTIEVGVRGFVARSVEHTFL
jgi:hypothetical protein